MGQAPLATPERDEVIRRELGEGLPDSMRQSVAELFFANMLTCTLYGVVWTFERRRQLETTTPSPPMPIPVALAVVVAIAPFLTAFARLSPTALAAILGTVGVWAQVAFNYRFLFNLRWRAERLGVRLEMGWTGWLGWFFFGMFYLQHKINQLARLERVLLGELAQRAPPQLAQPSSDDPTTVGDGTSSAKADTGAPRRLKNKAFWDLIDLVDQLALRRGDDVRAVAPLRAHLATAPLALRCAFHETLAQKLYAFDGPMFAAAAGRAEGDEDRGLLARTYVVACGQARYREVLATPEEMPRARTAQCAALLTVAADATEDAAEAPFVFVPSVGLATGSNVGFWEASGTQGEGGAAEPREDEPDAG